MKHAAPTPAVKRHALASSETRLAMPMPAVKHAMPAVKHAMPAVKHATNLLQLFWILQNKNSSHDPTNAMALFQDERDESSSSDTKREPLALFQDEPDEGNVAPFHDEPDEDDSQIVFMHEQDERTQPIGRPHPAQSSPARRCALFGNESDEDSTGSNSSAYMADGENEHDDHQKALVEMSLETLSKFLSSQLGKAASCHAAPEQPKKKRCYDNSKRAANAAAKTTNAAGSNGRLSNAVVLIVAIFWTRVCKLPLMLV